MMMDRLHLAVCPAVAFLLYYNTLGAGFVYDDRRAIGENVVNGAIGDVMIGDFWGTPLNHSGSHGSYRPLVTLSFRWTAQLAGNDSAYWMHLTNVLLHCCVTAAVTLTGRTRTIRYVSGLLFAAHPVHCEAVAGLVGRADVACALFFVAGVCSRRLVATLLLTCAAFFTKEYGVMLPPVCILLDVFVEKKIQKIRCIILTASTIILIYFRLWLSDFRTPTFSVADNPTAACPSWSTRTLTFLYLPVFHFRLMVWPRWLSFDWSMDAIDALTQLRDVRNLWTIVFYFALASAFRVQRTRKLLLLLAVPFVPATNALTYVGFVAAERILYLPSVAFCLLVATGAEMLSKRGPKTKALVYCSFSLLLASFAYRTVERNKDWIDEERLYRSAVEINPPKAYGNLGVVLLESGRLAEAEWSFKRALSYRPNMADVHHNLGNLFQQQSRYMESLDAYNRAIHYRSQLAESYYEKAKVLCKLQRWTEAQQTLLDCSRLTGHSVKDPKSHQAAKISATLLMADISNSNWLLMAKQLSPFNPGVYHQLGRYLSTRSRHDEAADVLIQAVELDPNSLASIVAAGLALHDASRNVEAEIYFRRAVHLDPTDASHRLNLGAVLHVQGKWTEARTVYEKALQLAPNHPLTLANLRRLPAGNTSLT